MKQKLLAPIRTTEAQRKWLEEEAARTGNSFAAIVRGLIQANIKKGAK